DSQITAADGHWIIGVVGSRLLMNQEDQSFLLSLDRLYSACDVAPVERLYLGRWQGTPCFAFIYPSELQLRSASGLVTGSLRSRLGRVADDLFGLAGRAQQLAHWYEFHRYCGRCGRATQLQLHERVLACSHC